MSALQNEIDKLKTLKESYHELSKKVLDTQAVLIELTHGKQEMVDALATKNVQSSTDKTLLAIASDIRSIAQSPVTIDGGEMYEKQLFGAPTDKTNPYKQPDAPMWNLYKVMTDLLSDSRFTTYGGILLAEYSKGGDTFTIEGAGAGGAYLTSDGKMYVEDVIHTWDDAYDGKGNRWIAYFFASEWHNFSIGIINPTSIHIGRNVGEITCTAVTKISNIVVTDGNMLKKFSCGSYSHKWDSTLVFKNVQSLYLYQLNRTKYLYCVMENITNIGSLVDSALESIIIKQKNKENPVVQNIFTFSNKSISSLCTCIIQGAKTIGCFHTSGFTGLINGFNNANAKIIFQDTEKINKEAVYNPYNCIVGSTNFYGLYFPMLELAERVHICGGTTSQMRYMYIGYKENNKTNPINLYRGLSSVAKYANLIDIEIKEGFCKPLSVSDITDVLTEENMVNHILKRLKQDEELCGEGVTITLGATNLARLVSEESVALLDSLTNTYGYTFA